ncbi:tRNA preQ1(34) S-adenosylmethionine ribosyltransferase-isomerase QueA [candidate division KSB1 bacterium]
MKLSDFKFTLPEKYIAQQPFDVRDESRLMVLDRKAKNIDEVVFKSILDYVKPGDGLVINETKVFPARIRAIKEKTDAQVEIFLLRELENNLWEVLVKPARKVRIGNKLIVDGHIYCDVVDNTVSGGRVVRFNYDGDFHKIIDKIGESPLPPYIKRDALPEDKIWYQTVYARVKGAVAAPTAGLHFTDDLLKKIKNKGVKIIPLVLHVGLGTFRPVVVEDLSRHRMDSEYYQVSEESAEEINEIKKSGGAIFAVGTSTVRVLETVSYNNGSVQGASGWTDKFIYPPYDFKVVNHLITNFHLPSSTLLMLVSAFAGRDFVFKAYRKAIKDKFRFYSYGDSMLVI